MSTDTDNFDAFVDFDFEGDDLDRDGGGALPAGYYEFALTGFTAHHEKSKNMDVELEVTGAEDSRLIGRVHHEFLKWPDASVKEEGNNIRKKLQRQLIYALALATKDQLKANPRLRLDFSKAIGATCYGHAIQEEYNGKVSAKLDHNYNLNLWSPDSPEGQAIRAKLGIIDTLDVGGKEADGAFGDNLDALID